jgi:di/tricarboxylate transporter
MIYLGCFVVTSALTHIMAHTAVAATIYPLLVAIYAMYGEGDKPTKFGKGLFIGMAYVAGAGSHRHPAGRRPGRRGPGVLQGSRRQRQWAFSN